MITFGASMSFRILLATSLALRMALAAEICYNKNGVQSPDALPCNPTADVGPCCTLGWICLSNGLCSPGPDVTNNGFVDYYRPDSCTDPSWNTDKCFSGCNSFQGNGLEACDVGTFCCYDMGGCDCKNSTTLLTLGSATFLTTLPLSTPTPTPSSSSSSIASSTAITTTSSTTSASTYTPAQAAAPSTTQAPEEKSNGAALGAGIGVGLGVPIIALSIILVIVIRRYKRRNAYSTPEEEKYEMEVPHVIHEAPEERYTPAQKYAMQNQQPQEMDAAGLKYTPGWGWHR